LGIVGGRRGGVERDVRGKGEMGRECKGELKREIG